MKESPSDPGIGPQGPKATTTPWLRPSSALFKTEVIERRGPWRSFDAVEYATLEWVDWFNLHFNITEYPAAAWTAQQIIEAFPEDTAPEHMIRDRDGIYGEQFRDRVKGMGIDEVVTAPRSPWQNPYAERLVGSIRRECLDHVIVLGERHLCRILKAYFAYYHRSRTHLSLGKDAPEPRAVQPPSMGKIVELPEVGGLHNRYERRAA